MKDLDPTQYTVTIIMTIIYLLMGIALNSGILKSRASILPILFARDGAACKIKCFRSGLIAINILPMREASKAAANAVANTGNDTSVSEIPSCLSYSPGIKTVTIEIDEKLCQSPN